VRGIGKGIDLLKDKKRKTGATSGETQVEEPRSQTSLEKERVSGPWKNKNLRKIAFATVGLLGAVNVTNQVGKRMDWWDNSVKSKIAEGKGSTTPKIKKKEAQKIIKEPAFEYPPSRPTGRTRPSPLPKEEPRVEPPAPLPIPRTPPAASPPKPPPESPAVQAPAAEKKIPEAKTPTPPKEKSAPLEKEIKKPTKSAETKFTKTEESGKVVWIYKGEDGETQKIYEDGIMEYYKDGKFVRKLIMPREYRDFANKKYGFTITLEGAP